MRLPFQKPDSDSESLRQPTPAEAPHLSTGDLAALYRGARIGGDFFDFVRVGPNRLVFVLIDIAGRREQALDIAAAVQEALRVSAPQLFGQSDLNESDAVTDLVLLLNQSILAAARGVRCAPAFVGCYQESMGIVSYINAGFVPALVRHNGSIGVLEASGLPLGLFSHATHDAQVCVLQEGAALLLASRGLVEVRSGTEEYGIERLKQVLLRAEVKTANELCSSVLQHVNEFAGSKRRRFLPFGSVQRSAAAEALGENDITTVALIRSGARSSAAAGGQQQNKEQASRPALPKEL
jgi:sigma-B regulation protein RsbU (phosphoserine phosphatase)